MKKRIAVAWILGILFLFAGCGQTPGESSANGGPTLPGADKIYPTVMAGGTLYEWRRGRAVLDALPDLAIYYADIEHSDNETPEKDGEFVSVFDAEGGIYTLPEDSSCVYLLLTTDWMEETAVVFDQVPA